MPICPDSFYPSPWLRNGHVQTVFAAVIGRAAVEYERERLELEDGDFVDLDRLESGAPRTAILSHGLEGSSQDGYVRGMAAALVRAGWNVVAWNYRGCGGETNRLLRAYHSGDTADLHAVVNRVAESVSCVGLVGFSLGGNSTLKYMGEGGLHPAICGAVAISAPVDLAASARALDEHWANRVYLRRLIRRLLRKIDAKALAFPDAFDPAQLAGVHGFQDFDDRFTAPLHGFTDARDYWAKSSARPFVPGIRVPSLLVNAWDDPFLTPECFPEIEARQSESFHLDAPRWGGHLGFFDSVRPRETWIERRTVDFLSGVA